MTARRLLLLEDREDLHLVAALLKQRQPKPRQPERAIAREHVEWTLLDASASAIKLEVKIRGVDEMLKGLATQFKETGIERMAAVLDADESVDGRWQAIAQRLRDMGHPNPPAQPDRLGTVVDFPDGRKFGVWIMPDNKLPGMLEDFLAFLVPHHDKLLPRVDAFLDGIPKEEKLFQTQHLTKARIHAWLAVQKSPGRSIGTAVTDRVLDPDVAAASSYRDWLCRALLD